MLLVRNSPGTVRIVSRCNPGRSAAQVATGEDSALDPEMPKEPCQVLGLALDGDVSGSALRDGCAVAHHLPGQAAPAKDEG